LTNYYIQLGQSVSDPSLIVQTLPLLVLLIADNIKGWLFAQIGFIRALCVGSREQCQTGKRDRYHGRAESWHHSSPSVFLAENNLAIKVLQMSVELKAMVTGIASPTRGGDDGERSTC
jgi:hypothetical protein